MANAIFAGQGGADFTGSVSPSNITNHVFGQFRVDVVSAYVYTAASATFDRTVLHVISLIPQPQVCRVDASWIVASVKNVCAGGDWLVVQFVRKAMRSIKSFSRVERTIPAGLLACLPLPTIIWAALIYLLPETICWWARSKMMTIDESPLSGWELRSRDKLTTSAFAESWGIMGLHKNLHFLCPAWDTRNVARHFSLVQAPVSIPEMGSDDKYSNVLHGKAWVRRVADLLEEAAK